MCRAVPAHLVCLFFSAFIYAFAGVFGVPVSDTFVFCFFCPGICAFMSTITMMFRLPAFPALVVALIMGQHACLGVAFAIAMSLPWLNALNEEVSAQEAGQAADAAEIEKLKCETSDEED